MRRADGRRVPRRDDRARLRARPAAVVVPPHRRARSGARPARARRRACSCPASTCARRASRTASTPRASRSRRRRCPTPRTRAQPAQRPRARTLLFASRLTPRKGLRSLLGALAQLAPARTAAARRRRRRRRGRTRRARASRTRRRRRDVARAPDGAATLRAAIDDADAVAVPSLWPEPFGLVGIEAQARGRPAVAYRVGGIGDWIGGAGIAVRRGDERALASAIGAVLDEPAWSALAATARAHAERYRLDAHVERLFDIFRGSGIDEGPGDRRRRLLRVGDVALPLDARARRHDRRQPRAARVGPRARPRLARADRVDAPAHRRVVAPHRPHDRVRGNRRHRLRRAVPRRARREARRGRALRPAAQRAVLDDRPRARGAHAPQQHGRQPERAVGAARARAATRIW